MLELLFNSGMYQLHSVKVEGCIHDDLLGLIDQKFYDEGIESLDVPYIKGTERQDDEEFYMIPVNGGEYWIPSLVRVEEVSM